MKNLNEIMKVQKAYDPYELKMKQTRKLADKWKVTGLLEGINNEYQRNGMAILLENQAKQLIKESTTTSTAVNSEEWSGVALPLVRRIFGQIQAKDFVSVQPMNLPSGLIFYMNFKYGSNSGNNFTVGDNIHGITSQADNNSAPIGGLYGSGRYGYSINNLTQDFAAGDMATSSANSSSINFDDTYDPADYVELTLSNVAANAPNFDQEGYKAFEVTSSNIEAFLPAFTKYNAATDELIFVVSGSPDPGSGSTHLIYHEQPVAYDRGDFEYSQSGVGSIPEVNLDIGSVGITAKTRKLKAVWTPEITQDLNAYHAIDGEAELTSMLAEYISMEIDLELLSMLLANTDTEEYWSARPSYEWNGSSFESVSTYAIPNKTEWYRTLGTKIQKVSNAIHAKTMRGGANFLVCGPDVATIIESMPGWNADTDGDKMQFAMGAERIGNIANRWTVYKNPYMKTNDILIGYRGASFLETGAVFAPYIPLIMTPLVYDPNNFTPRKGVMTRYAKKMIRPEFYGVIHVGHLSFV